MENRSLRTSRRAILLLGLVTAALTLTFSLLSLLAGPVLSARAATANDVSNNTPAYITGPGFADLEIAKSARPEPVLAGETLTYTVTITNHGPSTATLVSLIDTLPPAVTLPQTPAGCTLGSQLICGLSDISNGGAAALSFQIAISPTFTGMMTNTAVATAAETDPVTTNNLAQVQSTVYPRPVAGFVQASYSVVENAGSVPVTVTLDLAPALTVTVDYATAGGTATAGQDYVAASGTLTFPPGITTQAFAITILDEGLHEMSETISLTLSTPVNATLGLDTATLTILDNDHFLIYLPAAIKP